MEVHDSQPHRCSGVMPGLDRGLQVMAFVSAAALWGGERRLGAAEPPAVIADGDGAPIRAFLTWERTPGADSCVDGETLERAVELRVGRSVFVDREGAGLALAARIERVGTGGADTWRAIIEMRAADGRFL